MSCHTVSHINVFNRCPEAAVDFDNIPDGEYKVTDITVADRQITVADRQITAITSNYDTPTKNLTIQPVSGDTEGDESINIMGYNEGHSNTVLVGQDTECYGVESICVGHSATCTGEFAVAIGDSTDCATNSVALGSGADCISEHGIAIGKNARVNFNRKIQIGANPSGSTLTDGAAGDSVLVGTNNVCAALTPKANQTIIGSDNTVGDGAFNLSEGHTVVGHSNRCQDGGLSGGGDGTPNTIIGSNNTTSDGHDNIIVGHDNEVAPLGQGNDCILIGNNINSTAGSDGELILGGSGQIQKVIINDLPSGSGGNLVAYDDTTKELYYLSAGGYNQGFVNITSTGNTTISGLDFTPKAIEFIALGSNSSGGAAKSNGYYSKTGNTQYAISQNLSSGNQDYRISKTSCILLNDTSNNIIIEGTVTSVSYGEFTFNISTQSVSHEFIWRAFG